MKLIAHRGNINGSNPKIENHPNYVDAAIDAGFDVELDVWLKDGRILLGHDQGDYEISYSWLLEREQKLWIHCKNVDAMKYIHNMHVYNFFWHDQDDYTFTSKGYIWAYPGKHSIGHNTIMVMPERIWSFNKIKNNTHNALGICSDIVDLLHKEIL